MLSTVPVLVVYQMLDLDHEFSPDATLASISVYMLAAVGPVEETSKFLAIRLAVYRSLHFEEPMDGLVYGAAASMGFASLENLFYVIGFGPEVMLVRAPLSTLAHLLFGSAWGYGLGLRRAGHGSWVVWASIGVAAVLHGGFNIFVFDPMQRPFLMLVGVGLVVVGGFGVYGLFKWSQRTSPFLLRRNVPLSPCANCGEHVRVRSTHCHRCGALQSGERTSLICGNCRHTNRHDALFCVRCGDKLLT